MSKRKFKKGKPITSLDELLQHRYFIWNGRTLCAGFVLSWQVQMVYNQIRYGYLFAAERLTNEEFYAGKTDDQLKGMLEDQLCEFCILPEGNRGVRCYGGEPIMCFESGFCEKALEAWKEEYVE